MMEKDYKSLCAVYEKILGLGDNDVIKEGYLVMVDILKKQSEYLKNFKISDFIESADKDKVQAYKNAKDLWETMPKTIRDVFALRAEINVEADKKIEEKQTPISPQSIVSSNGKINV